MTLFVVIMVGALLTSGALLLFNMTRTEAQIAGNTRRIMQAKTAAVSGLNHFQAMNIFYEEIQGRAGELDRNRLEVIPETTLGDKTFYKVEVDLCCNLGDREFIVISTGYYKKADRVISSHVSRSLFKTVD